MALSDCPKCWDTPCRCGWEYREWSKADREDLAARVLGVSMDELRAAINTPEKHPLSIEGDTGAPRSFKISCREVTETKVADHIDLGSELVIPTLLGRGCSL